eukprot:m.177638 g.177638  ORF g.177638 m.177638 type:complete len:71 (+) comp14633_c0_seq10:522-734(+)
MSLQFAKSQVHLKRGDWQNILWCTSLVYTSSSCSHSILQQTYMERGRETGQAVKGAEPSLEDAWCFQSTS